MQTRNLVGLILAASILAGCAPAAQTPAAQGNSQAVATVVAQTLAVIQTPLPSPIAVTVAPTATPAQGKPTLSITINSNCRTGPGGSFKVYTSFTAGTKLEVVGRNTDNDYWQVKVPNSEETCWISGQNATASGNLDNVAEVTPVSSSDSLPARPGALFYKFECSSGTATITLTWSDSADNETGYHVYRSDKVIADLPPNSTTYTDTLDIASGTTVQYSVAAYNDAGESEKRTQEFPVCD